MLAIECHPADRLAKSLLKRAVSQLLEPVWAVVCSELTHDDCTQQAPAECVLWPVCDTYAQYRGSLSRRLWRFWRRCKARLKRVLSVMFAWPIALYHSLLRCMAACWWRSPSMPVKPEGSQDQNHFLADFDDRHILNGMVAEKTHSHVD